MLRTLLAALLLTSGYARADKPKLNPLCFDFSKPIDQPLMNPIPLLKDDDNFEQGVAPFDVEWSAARGVVDLPVNEIFDWLQDHSNWKDPEKTKLGLDIEPNEHFSPFHTLRVDAHIFAFVWLRWWEQWGYRVLKGTLQAPKELLVLYQKIKGTHHIDRLCGSVVVRAVDDKKSDIFFYEEASANRYKAENIRGMEVSNLFHLRQLAKSRKSASMENSLATERKRKSP